MVVRDPTGTSYAYWTNPLRFPATAAGALARLDLAFPDVREFYEKENRS